MQAIDTLGYVAAVLLTAMSIPQTLRAYRHGAQGVSLSTWLIVSFAISMWIGYGVRDDSLVLIIANIAGLAGTSATLVVLARVRGRSWLTAFIVVAAYSAVSVSIALLAPLPFVIAAAVLLPIASRIPQVFACISANLSKTATQVSRTTWILSTIGQLLWFAYGLVDHDAALIAVNISCVTLTCILLAADISNPANRSRDAAVGIDGRQAASVAH